MGVISWVGAVVRTDEPADCADLSDLSDLGNVDAVGASVELPDAAHPQPSALVPRAGAVAVAVAVVLGAGRVAAIRVAVLQWPGHVRGHLSGATAASGAIAA